MCTFANTFILSNEVVEMFSKRPMYQYRLFIRIQSEMHSHIVYTTNKDTFLITYFMKAYYLR